MRASHTISCSISARRTGWFAQVFHRGFHGIGPVKFHLEEVGGRLCLPAEDFVMQAMDCGFRIVASAGLRGDVLPSGMDAELAFHDSRQSWQA
jgi:hypothetical protein